MDCLLLHVRKFVLTMNYRQIHWRIGQQIYKELSLSFKWHDNLNQGTVSCSTHVSGIIINFFAPIQVAYTI